MFYKFSLPKIGTLLVIAGLMFSSSSSVFAQAEAVNPEPIVTVDATTAGHSLFLPLVQSDSATEVTAADTHLTMALIHFSGYDWVVKTNNLYPNYALSNVWLDTNSDLHLKINQSSVNSWSCAGLVSLQSFGFGQYEWQINGQIAQFNPNVVLKLGSKELSESPNGIAIEFARWGVSNNRVGNYTVNQSSRSGNYTTTYNFSVPPLVQPFATTHRFTWQSPQNIQFQSVKGYNDRNQIAFANWTFGSPIPLLNILQQPMPVYMDFCFFSGTPMTAQATEVVIHQFKYTPIPLLVIK